MTCPKRVAKAAAAALLAVSAYNTSAVSLNRDAIIKLTEPADNDSTGTWITDITGLNNVVTSSSKEFFSVTGTTDKKLPGDENGTHWGVLLEADGSISDVLKLVVNNPQTGQDPATVSLKFWSDGDPDFASVVSGLPTGYKTVKETGSLQSVGDKFLFNDNSGKLQIFVSSDVDPVTTPDSGATLGLFGLALAGILGARRLQK